MGYEKENTNDYDDIVNAINNDTNESLSLEKNVSDDSRKEAKTNIKTKVLKTEKDINESIEKITEMQNKFDELIKAERKRNNHALYEQIKFLK